MSADPRIQQAVQFIKSGDKAKARPITEALVREHPEVANLWYLAAMAASDKNEMVRLLNRALQIEPGHVKAKQALDRLDVPIPSAPVQAAPLPPPQPRIVSQPVAAERPADYKAYQALRRQILQVEQGSKSKNSPIYTILGLLGLIIGGSSLISGNGSDGTTLALTCAVPGIVLLVLGSAQSSRNKTAQADLPQLYSRANAIESATTSYGFKEKFERESTSSGVRNGCVGLLLFCALATYLLLTLSSRAGQSSPSSSDANLPSTGDWTLITEKSPIDNQTTYTLAVKANERIEGVYQSSIKVVCQRGQVVTGMSFETPLDLIETIILRFDSGFAITYNIHTSDNGRLLVFDDVDKSIKNLMSHNLLAVRAKTLLYGDRDITFDIRGLTVALAAVETKCR